MALPRVTVSQLLLLVVLLADPASSRAAGPSLPGFGTPGSGDGQLDTPMGVTTFEGSVYVADYYNHRIAGFSGDGIFELGWPARGGDTQEPARPAALAIDGAGHVFVADFDGDRILKFDRDGACLASWGETGGGPGEFRGPLGVAVSHGGEVFVTDLDNHRVQKFTNDGEFVASWGEWGSDPGRFEDPWGIALDSHGDLYVADHGNHRIQKFSPDGKLLAAWGDAGAEPGQLLGPVAVAVAPDDRVYVTDLVRHRVQAFLGDGEFVAQTEAQDATGAPFGEIAGVSVAPGGAIYLTDAVHHRIGALEGWPAAPPAALPREFAMRAMGPNPSAGPTSLRLALPARGRLTVKVFGVDGRLVRTLMDAESAPGEQIVTWDGFSQARRPVAPGIYFVRGSFDDGASRTTRHGRIVILR